MQYEFYDVKQRKKVKATVTKKVTYGKGTQKRYALKGQTKDGRSLTVFVKKEVYDKAKV